MSIINDKHNKTSINFTDSMEILASLKIKNMNKIIIGNININSIREKIDQLKYINK